MCTSSLRVSIGRIAAFCVMATTLLASAAGAQQLTFTPYKATGIYDLGERAGWTVTVPEGAAVPAGGFTYTVLKNNSETLASGPLDVSSGRATIEVTLNEPAMIYVRVRLAQPPAVVPSTPAAGPSATPAPPAFNLGAAFAPTLLAPAVPRPADFDAFWDSKLEALRAVPMNPMLEPAPTTAEGVDLYTVTLGSLNSHVHGYLAKPKREGKFPALVIFQYAGVYALQTRTVTDRAAEGWLTLDVDSHDVAPDSIAGVPRNYNAVGNTDRETSYFLNMYLRDTRAVDYIASRPDWDGRTLVIMGTSMGGQQSLVTAGLNPKVTAVLVNEPSGADSNGDLHGRKAGYPNWPSNDPAVMQTALYFDTVNFASRITAPAWVAMGFVDSTAPPVGIWTAFNQIRGPKEAIPMIEAEHNNITPQKLGAWDARSRDVLGRILRGEPVQPMR